MKTRRILAVAASLAAVIAILILVPPRAEALPADIIEFDDAKFYWEMNSTDEDLGIQFKLDGEPWKRIMIFNPCYRRLIDYSVRGNARVNGLTELFNESSEPPLSEFSLQEWLDLFPEGEYRFFGVTVEGDLLVGVAEFTHDIPDGPEITSPEDEDEVDSTVPLVIEWDPVVDPDPPESVIEAYQLIVEKDEDDERPQSLMVELPAGTTGFTVPVGFLEAGKDYKIEVLAIETSDNQTITEIAFETLE